MSDEADDRTFFPDRVLDDGRAPGSPTHLVPLLICETCPVRRRCLDEGLSPIPAVWFGENAHGRDIERVTEGSATAGIWGGSTEMERAAVRDLPKEEAAELLDRTTSHRLDRRIAEFERILATSERPVSQRRIIVRALALIEERRRRVREAA